MDRILADCQYWIEFNDVLYSFNVQYVVTVILPGTIFTESIVLFLVMTIEQSWCVVLCLSCNNIRISFLMDAYCQH